MKFTKIAAAALALIMLAGCSAAEKTPGTASDPQNQQIKEEKIDNTYEYIKNAAEKTAGRESYEFKAVGFGTGNRYDENSEQIEYTYRKEYNFACRVIPEVKIEYGKVIMQDDHKSELDVREFILTNGEGNDVHMDNIRALYSTPLNIVSHEGFADFVKPDTQLSKSEDGYNYVEFCTDFGNLVEFSTGEIRGYDRSKPVMMRFYVDGEGFLCRMEYDTAVKQDGSGLVYTTSFEYKNLSDGAIPQRIGPEVSTAPAGEFPAGRDNSTLTADMIYRPEFTLTREEAAKYENSMAIGHYDAVALTSSGKVLHAGEDGHPDPATVEGWSDIVSIDNEVGGVAAVTSDGRVLLSGFETESYQNWDLSQFTDIKTVHLGRKTLYGLKNDGTVVATGENSFAVSGWSGITQLSVGGDGSDIVVGLKADGTVIAEGKGTEEAWGWTDIAMVSAGRYHVIALKNDGTAVACGKSDDNQDRGDRAVGDWSDLVAVKAGNMVSYGIKSDGTVVACGMDHYNVLRVTEWNRIVAIYTGNICAVGLRADGKFITVGGSNYDELDFKEENWNLIG